MLQGFTSRFSIAPLLGLLLLGIPLGCARSQSPPAGMIAQDGRLEGLGKDLDPDDGDDRRDQSDVYDDDDDGLASFLFNALFSGLFALPFEDLGARYTPYPYAKYGEGHRLTQGDLELDPSLISFDARLVTHRVDSELFGVGFDSRFRLPSGFSVGYDFTRYYENVQGGRDTLNLWNVDLSVELPFDSSFTVDIGGGIGGISGAGSDIAGSYGLGVTLYPANPIFIRGSATRLHFDSSVLNDLQVEMGLTWKRVGVSFGYRGLVSPDFKLGGPILQLSFWL